MGTNYTRQSSYSSGDTITAAHSNNEFDRLESAFSTSGHSHDGTEGEGGAITKLTANCTVPDNVNLIFGTNSDVSVQYDETTTDSLRIAAAEGAALAVTFAADEGDDAGDEWKLNIADGGVLTLGNDINSAGTYVTHLTLTPNATVANSTAAFAGNVTVAGDLTISGDDLTMGTNTSGHVLVADGTNFNPVALSGDVTVAANGAVTIANGAVENAMLADDAVGADELAANAVVTASIVDDNVTQAKIADDAVGADQLAANAVVDASVASSANIAVSKTALTAGTNISLSTNTLNVDDAFLINSGDDTTSGVITSAGYKLNVGAGSGDVTTQFQQGGTTLFTVGIDDSDSEKFKIHSSTALADTSDFEITSAGVVSLGSDLNVAGNTILTGNLTVNGTTTTVNTATLGVVDPIIHLQTAADGGALGSDTNKDVGIVMQYHNGSAAKNAFLGWDDSAGKLTFVPDASLSSEVVSGSVGTIVANLEGNVTGTAATVTGAAQSNITSLGTLTTLTVDSIRIDGTNIGHTSDTDAMAISSGGVVTFSQVPLFPADTIETADIQADAVTGAKIADDAIDSEHYTDGSIDLAHISTAAKTEVIAIACGDETTATAAATAVVTFHMPYAFYLTGIKAGVTTAPVGSVLTVDLNEAGSTCLTTKLTIDAGEKTSATAATAAVIGGAGPALAADALMTIDVDGVGSSTAGAGLKVYLIGYQT
jgi:hypothetical protein